MNGKNTLRVSTFFFAAAAAAACVGSYRSNGHHLLPAAADERERKKERRVLHNAPSPLFFRFDDGMEYALARALTVSFFPTIKRLSSIYFPLDL